MRIFFDHLQKTGGTSLNELFARMLGRNNVTPVNMTDKFSTVMLRYAHCAAIAGHVEFLPGDALPADRLCLTLLRDPIERCLSWYAYNRNDVKPFPGPSADVVAMCRSMSLLDCVRSASPLMASSLHDYQVNHFARMQWDGATDVTGEEKLAMAKRALDQYQIVGVQEDFEDFVDVICARMGWPPTEAGPRLKFSSKRIRREELDAETLAALLEANRLDIELHAAARERFRRIRREEFRRVMVASESSTAQPLDRSDEGSITDASKAARDFGNRKVRVVGCEVLGHVSRNVDVVSGERATITLVLESDINVDNLTVGIMISEPSGALLYGDNTRLHGYRLKAHAGSRFRVGFTFRADLGEGAYVIGGAAHVGSSHLEESFHWRDRVGTFNVSGVLGTYFEGRTRLHPQLTFGSEKGAPVVALSLPVSERIAPAIFGTGALQDFRSGVAILGKLDRLPRSAVTTLAVEVENRGSELWPATGDAPVRLSYHWYHRDGGVMVFDGARTDLPHDLAPGDSVQLEATLTAPHKTGYYLLSLSLLQEGVAWFDERGSEPARIPVEVG